MTSMTGLSPVGVGLVEHHYTVTVLRFTGLVTKVPAAAMQSPTYDPVDAASRRPESCPAS